jgi:hypothetical protein
MVAEMLIRVELLVLKEFPAIRIRLVPEVKNNWSNTYTPSHTSME